MRIVHLLYSLDVGGLESVLVSLINHLPWDRFEHHVIALTRCGQLKNRIQRSDVHFYDLEKQHGKDWWVWFRLWKLLRQIRPDLIHSFNIATLEGAVSAFFAGRPVVVHAEHGRDSYDPKGENRTYILLRRILNPLVDTFICVSRDLHSWLRERVHIPERKIRLIVNGIDTQHFAPGSKTLPPRPGFADEAHFIIGTVGRLWPIKDQANLIRALALMGERDPLALNRSRVVLLGDGPQRRELEQLAQNLGVFDQLWITGWRDDVAQLLHCFDLFVLPSQAEGTPLTILEAMASGLPVVATNVGGVADVIQDEKTGTLVPPQDSEALMEAILRHLHNPHWSRQLGTAARQQVQTRHSLTAMVESYRILFLNRLLQKTE
ncbi:MAG: TIGR03088 family PEP-CTERM/XrtA system glycosyltransferase [Magnetococcales bacterium]|nr:TIGR03088 family PEP-CTERM/XrtA system glycosyltransferase [Magnetococcales bacterium]